MAVADYGDNVPVEVIADTGTGTLKSGEYTLSASAGTVTSIAVPSGVRGFRLYPRSNNCRFAVGEDPAAVGVGALATGAIAKADQWETRILPAGAATVRLRSTTASLVVDVEFF